VSRRVELSYGTGVTPIEVGAAALDGAREWLSEWVSGRTVFVITSAEIEALHGAILTPYLEAAQAVHRLEVPDGEAAKVGSIATDIWSQMLALGGKRDSRLIAFGGGTVTDLGGFIAGCFLRGIEFVGIPTTLLGQVDAAVGGKTGINLPEGKNTVGLFFHPELVLCDTRWLATLDRGDLRAGLMEVVKMAYLLDPPLLDRVEADAEALLVGDAAACEPIVFGAVSAKVGVVERDPTEQGPRKLLNFGHTLGHGIEAVLRYGELRHGEAVGYGMLFALRLSLRRGLDLTAASRLRDVIRSFDLPPLPALDPEALLSAMAKDKKARESGLAWVLARAIGEGWVSTDVELAEVRRELDGFLASPWDLPALR